MKARLGRLPPKEAELARLLRDEKIATDIYTSLLSQYEEVRVNEAAKIASVRLIEPAVVPDTPVFPQKGKYLLLAAVVGLLLGFSIAIFLEHFDDSVRSLAEVKEILPYDVLGYIPYHKSQSMLFMASAPRSPVSEALRLVQANFKFKPIAREKSFSIMVTSAMPGEGKSTIAANLSVAFAGSGTRAAVVSLDLRRPVFEAIFDRKMNKGITDYLIGESTLEDIMVGEDGRGVTIVPSGTIPPNPSELVSSKKVPELIRYMKEHFDVVIYDTPPITVVAETLDLARYVDGIILVVDTSIATRNALRAMNDLVSNKDLVILGTVLNNVNRRGSSYHYYGGYFLRGPVLRKVGRPLGGITSIVRRGQDVHGGTAGRIRRLMRLLGLVVLAIAGGALGYVIVSGATNALALIIIGCISIAAVMLGARYFGLCVLALSALPLFSQPSGSVDLGRDPRLGVRRGSERLLRTAPPPTVASLDRLRAGCRRRSLLRPSSPTFLAPNTTFRISSPRPSRWLSGWLCTISPWIRFRSRVASARGARPRPAALVILALGVLMVVRPGLQLPGDDLPVGEHALQ